MGSGFVSGSSCGGGDGGCILGVDVLRDEEVNRDVKEKELEWWRVNSGELEGMDADWPIQGGE